MAIVPKDKQRDGRRKRLALSKKDKMIMTGRLRLGKVCNERGGQPGP